METVATAAHSSLSEKDDRALLALFRAYTVTATLWLLLATGVGILMAFKFGALEFGSGAWLTFGRLRPIHTNATFYGAMDAIQHSWPNRVRVFINLTKELRR